MNGAESLVHTLLASGVDACFANPGTSEMHFVAALDRIPGMHCVLGLHENVVTGMADGYYRIARRPACTLLHCGPGLANGLANLHNARRAGSAIVNIVGDQATWHRPFDAPLTADTDALARTVSAWVRSGSATPRLGADAAAAVAAAKTWPGQIATLILPADVSWQDGGAVGVVVEPAPPAPLDPHAIDIAARWLREHRDVLLLVGGAAVLDEGQRWAWRLAAASGAALRAGYTAAHLARGRGRAPIERVPYAMSAALQALAPYKHVILVGATPAVGFFGYPGEPSSQHPTDVQFHVLARPEQDAVAAMRALSEAIGAPDVAPPDPGPRPSPAHGAPSPDGLAQTVAALLPEHAIVADESVSFGRGFYRHTHAATAHDWLHLAGGAIGDGMPLATGAAIGAGGERRVLNLQADGSAMYSLQSLWTQARERLPVTTILINNRRYNILLGEYRAVGATPGPTALGMLELGDPELDWVGLARGMGVEAARATTLEACADLMRASFAADGPFLIELIV